MRHISALNDVLIFLSVFLCATAARPHIARAAEGANPSSLQTLNLSALPTLPDADFRYIAAYHSPSLPNVATTMACVAAMQGLARKERIDTVVRDSERWPHPEYPGVSIALTSEPGVPMTARWGMFLLNAAIRDMMMRQRYEVSIFFGWYKEVKIGRITFYPTGTSPPGLDQVSGNGGNSSSSSSGTLAVSEGEAAGTPPAVLGSNNDHIPGRSSFNLTSPLSSPFSTTSLTSSTPHPLRVDELHADVDYLAKPIDRRDAFITVIYLLMSLGGRGLTPLHAYHCTFAAITAEVRTIWNSVDQQQRSQPAAQQDVKVKGNGARDYLFNAGDMVNMLADLAVLMQREGKYAEMNIAVSERESGTVIARGAIRTKPLKPTGAGGGGVGTGWVSVS